ncbi:hypothetical protein MKW94_020055 [Papaver nudicaule]|uniref:Uncharacterized protein n=1 Tax=Papaver nudicaule TaxID=74823 RepID=A0AA41VIZ2_PAPNU|nr:hypothetical protein [Papaver nudicaule]
MAAVSMSACSATTLNLRNGFKPKTSISSEIISHAKFRTQHRFNRKKMLQRKFTVFAVTKGSSSKSSESEEKIPSWAKPDSEEPPPWAQGEGSGSSNGTSEPIEIPFYAYLLASTITAIAAIGSVFEYVNQKPVFGLLSSDSIFYAPVLGFFAFTGVPTSAFLWYKSVQAANKAAEEQDKRDGY